MGLRELVEQFNILTGQSHPPDPRDRFLEFQFPSLPLRAAEPQPAATQASQTYPTGINHHELMKEADLVSKHALAQSAKLQDLDPNDQDAGHHNLTAHFLHQYAHDLYRKAKRHALKNGDRKTGQAAHVAAGEHLGHAAEHHQNAGTGNV